MKKVVNWRGPNRLGSRSANRLVALLRITTARLLIYPCEQVDIPGTGTTMDQVDQLLRNARLRDEIEPFVDESIAMLDSRRLPIDVENEFLESMLDWERSPVLPISQWFDPELQLPAPDTLDDGRLHGELVVAVKRLHDRQIVLEFTDHLSDRELYCLILRDILPAQEKRLRAGRQWLRWQCLDAETDAAIWLAFYADDDQRDDWLAEHGGRLPPRRIPPFPRFLPARPDQASF